MTIQRRLRPWHEVVRLKDELRTGELAPFLQKLLTEGRIAFDACPNRLPEPR